MKVRMLGPIEVEDGGRTLGAADFGGRKPKQLLEILLIERGHIVPRDRLIELLWAGEPPRDAEATLDTYASLVRKRLGAGRLRTVKPGYVIDCSDAQIDVDRFQALVEEARQARALGELDRAAQALSAARQLYRGPCLEDEPYADWALGPRELLEGTFTSALLLEAETAAATGHFEAALRSSQQAIALQPASEEGYRQLMLWSYALGRQNEALQAFERCRRALASELGVDPLPQTSALHQRILNAVPAAQLLEEVLPPGRRRTGQPLQLPFLDREVELAELDAAWQAVAGGAVLMLIEGPAGIGKSQLVSEFLKSRPMRFAPAKCTELQSELPFGALSSALAGLFRTLPETDRERVRSAAPELAELLPELGPPAVSLALPPEVARTRLLDSIGLGLEAVAPAALFLDDLQWADVSTVQALDRILQRVPTASILLLAAYRSANLAITDLAKDALSAGRLRTIRLGPLPRAALDALLPLGADPAELWAITGGHPLFVAERLRAQAGEDLHEAILSRVRPVGAVARDLLEAASVFERPFRPSTLAEVTGQADEAWVAAVDELVAQRLLIQAGDGLSLSHDLVRDTIYQSLSSARREHLHRRAFEVLQAAGSPPSELASHALAGGRWAAAVEYSQQAGDAALELFANVEAAGQFARAIQLLHAHPGLAGPGQMESLLVRLARALIVVGRTDDAVERLNEAGDMARARGDKRGELEAAHWLGMAFWSAWRPSLAVPHGGRALRLAEELNDRPLVGRAHAFLANPHGSLGQLNEALGHARQALRIAEELGQDPPATALYRIGIVYHQRAEELRALEALELGESLALRQHDERSLVFVRWVRACALANLGRYEEAWAALAAAEAFGRREEAVAHARIPNTRAAFYADLGLWDQALEYDLESLDAIPASGGLGVKEPLIHTLLNLAEDHLALGAMDRAQAAVEQVAHLMPDAEYARFRYENRLHYVRGLLALAAEDWPAALQAAEACLAQGSAYQAPKYQVRGQLVKGVALARLIQLEDGQAELRQSARLAERLGYSAWAWRAWAAAGDQARAGKAVQRLAAGLDGERREHFLRAAKRFSKGHAGMLAPWLP